MEIDFINNIRGNQMYPYLRPTGNIIKLMDGRIFKKNQKNLWEDINSGVSISDTQLQNFITSTSLGADASGGGSRRASSAPAEQTSLSAPFDDIVINGVINTETFNVNRTVVNTGSPATLRVTFSSVGSFNNGTFKAYKNDVEINQVGVSASSAGLVTTLTGTFADGDQLKFSYEAPSTNDVCNFDVTIEKTAPGATSVLDVFNIAAAFSETVIQD
jgi:hypothetical protein